MTKTILVQITTAETALNYPIQKKVYIIILIYSWSIGG